MRVYADSELANYNTVLNIFIFLHLSTTIEVLFLYFFVSFTSLKIVIKNVSSLDSDKLYYY